MQDLLAQLARSVDRAHTVDELVPPLLEMLQAVTGLESTYLTSIDPVAHRQEVLFARNAATLRIEPGMGAPWPDTLCRRAQDEGVWHVDDATAHWPDADAARTLGLRTFLTVPVRAADGAVFGTLCAAGRERREIDADAGHVLRLFSRLIGDYLERERLVQQLVDANTQLAASALTDALTGLPNRRALELELSRMLARVQRDDRALVVAYVDLDDFKAINDRHGHDAGDRFLVAMAAALESTLRGGDLVARIGGDEFVVAGALPRENAEGAAEVVRDRLEQATRGSFQLASGLAIDYAGASVGVELARTGEIDATALIDRADRAMYEAKARRRRHPRR